MRTLFVFMIGVSMLMWLMNVPAGGRWPGVDAAEAVVAVHAAAKVGDQPPPPGTPWEYTFAPTQEPPPPPPHRDHHMKYILISVLVVVIIGLIVAIVCAVKTCKKKRDSPKK
ncbi:unnamed protein product [Cuscuta europaea]|uniref:Transmembrane protein n=1 Tax=Cuscuta europaea TaxID=41803 RepID=A0A9P0Z4L1_CUSEU|nr:unnamed protein product [Cuscuta europaea]